MFGYGGVSFVARAAGLSRTTLYSGSSEVGTVESSERGPNPQARRRAQIQDPDR